MNVRPFGEPDFEAVVALLREDEEHTFQRPSQIEPSDLREWTSRTNLAENSWLFEEDGELRAVGWADLVDDLGIGIGIVHPRWRGTGLGAQLLERSEANARARGAARMQQFTLGPDTAAAALMAAHGYRDVRHFYEMAIEQTEPPPPVDLPVETVREEDMHGVSCGARRGVPGSLGASLDTVRRVVGSAREQPEPRPLRLVPDPRRRRDRGGHPQ